jgi:transposase InsO family protein
VDGTPNSEGPITHYVVLELEVQGHREKAMFFVTNLGRKNMIVGKTWLQLHNPEIDWRTGKLDFTRCPDTCGHLRDKGSLGEKTLADEEKSLHPREQNPPLDQPPPLVYLDEIEDGDRIFMVVETPDQHEINAQENISTRLAIDNLKKSKPTTLEDILRGPYYDFVDVFDKKDFDELPPRKKWDHAIELIPDAKNFRTRLYPLSKSEQEELDKFLEENLRTGRIRSSKSPMASPFFFVKKKDGALRPVQDYRKLNEMTIKNSYPIPLINELVDKIRGAKIFSKLDIRWGYNNVRIREGDEWKAAFVTNRGLFEPLVMFFGLCNSPSTFQTMMNEILEELVLEGHVLVYLDDILIFTETLEEHRKITRRVLEILRRNKLYLKPEKCEFEKPSVEYLGLIVSHNQVSMDPVKLEGVRTWPTPKTVREVRGFLGFTGFYRRFIRTYSDLARPLNDLLKKDKSWKWGSEQQKSFESIRDQILKSPILVFPDFDKQKMIETDSSTYASGGVLNQLEDDGKWHPVAFLSKGLTPAERNYTIGEQELLAIIKCLKTWRHLLEGTNHPITVWTDHKNLEAFKSPQNLNPRQARWSSYLTRFELKLVHRPGRSSGKPDALSRRADHDKGANDNLDRVLLHPEMFINVLTVSNPLLEAVKAAQDVDKTVIGYRSIKSLPSLPPDLSWIMDGMLLIHNKVYAPEAVRYEILKQYHDSAVSGHPGIRRTHELIFRDYYWPRMGQYITNYVNNCDTCARTKIFPAKPIGELYPNSIPEGPWQKVSVDMIVQLPESNGYDSILVIVDRFTKMIRLATTTTEVTSVGVAKLYRDHVWRSHGMPIEILSDRGSTFASAVMRELNTLLGINTHLSTAYHPQTDGQTERINQEVEQYLRVFCNHRQNDWSEWLTLAEFAYNNRQGASTHETPFFLNYGRHPRMGFEPVKQTNVQGAAEFSNEMKESWKEARSALTMAAEDMARFYNEHRREAPEILEGDRVWLSSKNLRTDRPSKKLDYKRLGPFKVIKRISSHAYRLELPKSMRIHPVFHVSLLRKAEPDPILERRPSSVPTPEIEGGVEKWDIEQIDDSRIRYRKLQYLVRWLDFPLEERTWEPAEGLWEDQPELVRRFHREHPAAPRPAWDINALDELVFQPIENLTDGDVDRRLHPPDWEFGVVHRDVAP